MENKKIISLAIVSVVMGTTIATASANGIRERSKDPIAFSEVIRAEREALRSGDYKGWKSAVENSGQTEILEAINESNFARFSQAFTLCESGDIEGARAIIIELEGAELPQCALRKSLGLGAPEREALNAALANSDYDGWQELMERGDNDGLAEYLTEENFGILARAYRLLASGDRAGAMQLLDDADIPAMMLPRGGKKGGASSENAADGTRREALTAAYESEDYGAWKDLMEGRGGKILEIVNADNFSQFARAKLLQEDGQAAEAKGILDDLGFPFSDRKTRGSYIGAGVRQG